MRKVITGSLNGNAYQFEEGAFNAVQACLARAASKAATAADRSETLADLERTIADQCDTFLGKHKNVITNEEAQQILRELGPLGDAAPDAAATGESAAHAAGPTPRAAAAPLHRKLYRIPGAGVLGGVCAGLADYFAIDVVWVRLIYILLAITTGVWLFVWIAQLIVTPKAECSHDAAGEHPLGSACGR